VALTVAQVLALPELGLVLRTDRAPVDRLVRWVAVSELLDPTPWIEGGDLLLTTGMSILDDPGQASAYVERLVAADVAALGFGIGLTHQSIPATLIAAADRFGLPVAEVPEPVPFVAVSKAVSRLLSTEEYAESAASFESQRRLIRAALSGDIGGTDEVVALLARHVRGFCLHLGRRGEVLAARPRAAASRAPDFAEEVERLRPRGVLASSAVSSAEEHVVIVPLGVRGAADGFLVVGAPERMRPADQAVVNVAVSLLSWSASRPTPADGGMDPWYRLLADVGLGALNCRQAVAAVWRGPGGTPVPDQAYAAITTTPGVLACRRPSGEVVGFVSVDEDGRPPAEVVVTAGAPGVTVLGVSCRRDMAVASNVRQAFDQADRAASVGSGLQVFDEEPTRGLTSLIAAAATSAWAHGYLGGLLTTPEGPELVNTLRAWLDKHGQVDAAAQQLGIHRHTVRHRLRRAEAVLGRSLEDPGVRADLWFAIQSVGPDRQSD
jgi:purine catabolism regulator